MRICVYEDAGVSRLAPLTMTRPAFELRCGATTLLGRQLWALPAGEAGAVVRPDLAEVSRWLAPGLPVNDQEWLAGAGQDDLVLVNARWLAPAQVDLSGRPEVGVAAGQVAYVALPAGTAGQLDVTRLPEQIKRWEQELPHREVGGVVCEYPWDLVEANVEAIHDDFLYWRTVRPGADLPAGVVVVGSVDRIVRDAGATVEPLAFLDASRGPILLDRGCVVRAFSRIDGPCYIGPGTQVQRAHVQGSSIGPNCRIGGEVESAIVQGHANKAHEGFLGHSYVGEWVNLGAGTHTSDLRNDYGLVSVILGGARVDTGLLKVGSFIGDHTKTSIGCLFNTGSVVGPFGQLVTSGDLLPRYLPAFCQYSGGKIQNRTDLGRMFATAQTAMARRGRPWTEVHAEFFLGLYERTAEERQRAMSDGERRQRRQAV